MADCSIRLDAGEVSYLETTVDRIGLIGWWDTALSTWLRPWSTMRLATPRRPSEQTRPPLPIAKDSRSASTTSSRAASMPLDGPRRWPWLNTSGSIWAPCASTARNTPSTWPPSRSPRSTRPVPGERRSWRSWFVYAGTPSDAWPPPKSRIEAPAAQAPTLGVTGRDPGSECRPTPALAQGDSGLLAPAEPARRRLLNCTYEATSASGIHCHQFVGVASLDMDGPRHKGVAGLFGSNEPAG